MTATPDPKWKKRLPALFLTDAELRRAALSDSQVAQLRELHEPHMMVIRKDGSRELRPIRRLSHAAVEHPVIAKGLDRARNHDRPQAFPLSAEDYGEDIVRIWENGDSPYHQMLAEGCRLGIDPSDRLSLHPDEYPARVLLNTGRPPQPKRRDDSEYTVDDLRKHDQRRRYYEGPHVVEQIAEAERLWQMDYDRISTGGFPTQAVIVHNDADDVGTVVYPVPMGCSPERRARLLWIDVDPDESYRCCWWCEGWQDQPIDAMMAVSCGATLRVFPTCPGCHDQFVADLGGVVDFQYLSDREFFLTGMPDDMYLDPR